ncbi:hypothetical protein OBV_04660 [Oscillibacter valericigenes Sjm18-20]|nr:hypothetical protein OBV_04660 [Oscillibacter valericigenes Sjm18-20]
MQRGWKSNQTSLPYICAYIYKSYDELLLFFNADTVAKVLGVSSSTGYELLHERDFPALKIRSRIVIPKEKFIAWVEANTGGSE